MVCGDHSEFAWDAALGAWILQGCGPAEMTHRSPADDYIALRPAGSLQAGPNDTVWIGVNCGQYAAAGFKLFYFDSRAFEIGYRKLVVSRKRPCTTEVEIAGIGGRAQYAAN